jgi:hypothetical protein
MKKKKGPPPVQVPVRVATPTAAIPTGARLDGCSKNAIDGFAARQETDEWRCAEGHRTQIALVTEALHLRCAKATFHSVGCVFSTSKGVAFKEYEKSQQAPRHGRQSLLSDGGASLWLDCFEKGTPATYAAIARFPDLEITTSISPGGNCRMCCFAIHASKLSLGCRWIKRRSCWISGMSATFATV